MGRPPAIRPQLSVDHDTKVYELIKSKGDRGIWRKDMRRETKLPDNILGKALKNLEQRNKIKTFNDVTNPKNKMYILAELEPSKEITGGTWYSGKSLDTDLIEILKKVILMFIRNEKIATLEMVADHVRKKGVLKVELQAEEIKQILDAMVLDKEIEEFKSSMGGDSSSRMICYRCAGAVSKSAALALLPCGVCPKISECTPDGIISPNTCVYFKEWLNF